MFAFALPGGWEIWSCLLVFLLLFGNRFPGMMRALGSTIIEFKRGAQGDED